VEDRLEVMAVRVEEKCRVVVRAVWTKAGRAVIDAAGLYACEMEGINLGLGLCCKGEVRSRYLPTDLLEDQRLFVEAGAAGSKAKAWRAVIDDSPTKDCGDGLVEATAPFERRNRELHVIYRHLGSPLALRLTRPSHAYACLFPVVLHRQVVTDHAAR
jgi:hypothetical protein